MPKKPVPEWPVIEIERIWRKGHREEVVKQTNGGTWRVTDLREIVKDEPVFDIPLAFLPLDNHTFDLDHGLVDFAIHMKHVQDCDLSFPVIFSEFGQILDGRHRIVKALLAGHATIKAVRVPSGYSTTMPPG